MIHVRLEFSNILFLFSDNKSEIGTNFYHLPSQETGQLCDQSIIVNKVVGIFSKSDQILVAVSQN